MAPYCYTMLYFYSLTTLLFHSPRIFMMSLNVLSSSSHGLDILIVFSRHCIFFSCPSLMVLPFYDGLPCAARHWPVLLMCVEVVGHFLCVTNEAASPILYLTLFALFQFKPYLFLSSYSHFYVWSMYDDIRLHVARSYTSSLSEIHLSLCPTIFS